jgi:hypothetical protein
MTVLIPTARAWGAALVAASFTVAVVESGVLFHADQVIPGWDKAIHAACAFGLVLALSPTPDRRRRGIVAVIAIGLAWEAAQFWLDPLQGHTVALYAVDTVTDLTADVIGALAAARPLTRTAAPRPIRSATPR